MASRAAFQCLYCGPLAWRLDAHPSCCMGASSHFRLKVRCHLLSWMPARRCRRLQAARFQNLRHIILNASAAHLNEEFSPGNERDDKPQRKLNIDTVLVVLESFCITVSALACIASTTMHGSLLFFTPQKVNLYVWQNFFLLAALIINAVLRARHWRGRNHSKNLTMVANTSVEERLQKLEEESASVVTIIRVLSKQLEKLAVRFRVTRQTLRDPIKETAVLAQKTSESVNILAAREDGLEKSLEEIHNVLLGMQENQTKQLELIATLGKLVKNGPRDKLENGIGAGRKDQAGTLLGGRVRMDNSDGSFQKKVLEKLGNLKNGSAKLIGQKMPDNESSDNTSAQQSKESSKAAQSTGRVDFWLSNPAPKSMQNVEEPVRVARSRDHLRNDGRMRSGLLDSTSESSFPHSDAKE